MIRGFIDAKKLDPLFYQTQAVERAKSGISTRNMADVRRMNTSLVGNDLGRLHSFANEKLCQREALISISSRLFPAPAPGSDAWNSLVSVALFLNASMKAFASATSAESSRDSTIAGTAAAPSACLPLQKKRA